MEAWAEVSFARGWMTVCEPIWIWWVPVREALSAMVMLEEREVGGGLAGIVEGRLEDDMFKVDVLSDIRLF